MKVMVVSVVILEHWMEITALWTKLMLCLSKKEDPVSEDFVTVAMSIFNDLESLVKRAVDTGNGKTIVGSLVSGAINTSWSKFIDPQT